MVIAADCKTTQAIIPQTKAMAFISQVTDYDNQARSAVFPLTVTADKAYFQNGSLATVWLLEIMAQCAAALFNLESQFSGSKPKIGFLVGIEQLDIFRQEDFLAGTEIQIIACIEEEFHPFALYRFKVECDDQTIATAKIKFVVDDNGEFKD